MPELPEVETTLRGITPHIAAKTVTDVIVRQARLRYPIPDNLKQILKGETLLDIERRAKYLLLRFRQGVLIIHLGMSGSLRIIDPKLVTETAPEKHDHVDVVFEGTILRFRDPRRFGMVLWTEDDIFTHPLLCHLGPEPFDTAFNADYLFRLSRKKKVPTKQFIMDNKIVVGVGNIYASESLFMSSIRPGKAAGRLSRNECTLLVENICSVLKKAIQQGGTSLKDFTNSEGKPGYFAQSLNVYGRTGEECYTCGQKIRSKMIGQRNTFYCPHCQH